MWRLRRAGLLLARRVDRWRLARLQRVHAGLRVHPDAHAAFAVARYNLAPGARLIIGPGAATERIPGALSFVLYPDAEVRIEAGAWLRTEVGPVVISAWPGARIRIGPEAFLNACTLSAKQSLEIGRRTLVGAGVRIYDADQHDFDAEHPERVSPVSIGECAWLCSGATVLCGVSIGAHAVVGAHALVNSDVPAHTFVGGVPARSLGPVGDRSNTN